MIKNQINHKPNKSRAQVITEYVLLAMCLCVISIRTIITESPSTQSSGQLISLGDSIYSVSISAVMILSLLVWIITVLLKREFSYRVTWLEIGAALFIFAGVIACIFASNKRDGITNFVIVLSPILMAILLVQILDSNLKIKLVLGVIVALGFVTAYQCAQQYFIGNDAMIKQYEQSPESILDPLGVEPGTLNHMLFEHRLYSRDVKGFFTTGNSAGSFLILSVFAAIALVAEKIRNRKGDFLGIATIAGGAITVGVTISALAITRSKGAIAASTGSAVMLACYLLFGKKLKIHRKALLALCLAVVIVVTIVTIFYGVTHDRLPGGNSMLVRWQYWKASIQMFADHWWTGVGPGNFGIYYTHYKPAGALETVSDPHNFILAVLTQYGPLGLIAFLGMIMLPLWKVIFPAPLKTKIENTSESEFVMLIPILLTVVIFIMASSIVAGVFLLGFVIAVAQRKKSLESTGSLSIAVIFCAAAAVLVHNTIDFAIFEPGVSTAFWTILACLIALNSKDIDPKVVKVTPGIRAIGILAVLIAVLAFFRFSWIPTSNAGTRITEAINNISVAHSLLDQAAKEDKLDPAPLNLQGRLYVQQYENSINKRDELLKKASKCFLGAVERNRANYKNYEKLMAVNNLLGDSGKAYEYGIEALNRYPGLGRIEFELGQTAEKIGNPDQAIEHYQRAIAIEDAYRKQFKIMYPGRKIFSRLGNEKYELAKNRVTYLTSRQKP